MIKVSLYDLCRKTQTFCNNRLTVILAYVEVVREQQVHGMDIFWSGKILAIRLTDQES